MDAIEVTALRKSFGRTVALDSLDLTVHAGEVHAFLGPNGAGKTTTIRILLGLLRQDGGQARLLGGDPWHDAVALHARCTEGTGPARPLVRADLRLLSYGVVAVTAVMLAAGTVVTGTGPLAGAAGVPRYHLPLTGATQLHSDIGWLLGGVVLPLVLGLRLTRAPVQVMRLGWLLLGLLLMQGAVGYTQYFTGLPAGLVWVHVTGSLLIWIVALRLVFAVRDRGPLLPPQPGQPGEQPALAGSPAEPATAR